MKLAWLSKTSKSHIRTSACPPAASRQSPAAARQCHVLSDMGGDWSTPSGQAEVPSALLPFTVWDKDDLRMMKKRHAVSLGGEYVFELSTTCRYLRLLYMDRELVTIGSTPS